MRGVGVQTRGLRPAACGLLFLLLLGACATSHEIAAPTPAAECQQDADCPAPAAPCRSAACREGRCAAGFARPGTFPEVGQKTGDCQRFLCGVGGELIARDDPADTPPDDGNLCTREICSGGAPGRLPVAPGASCGLGVCSSTGACVGLEEIAVGRYHGCLRLGDGSVRCWGAGERGQLGREEDDGDQLLPALVQGLSGARSLALGGSHSCALLRETVACWGANEHGQLGDGSTQDHRAPAPVQGLRDASALAAGLDSTCAIAPAGLFCWGLGASGQLGNGARASSSLPVKVSLDTKGGQKSPFPRQIGVGGAHACALLEGGQLRCWGANEHGQLGDGSTQERLVPVAVPGLTGVKQVAVGRNHTCALRDDGTVWCWGWNNDGQLGSGERNDATTPRKVSTLAGVAEIAAGNSHNCARMTSGKVACWGWNRDGQVSSEALGDATEPVELELKGTMQLALGSKHSCARLAEGAFSCWGNNGRSQLGKE